jgi:hypothetical protein
MAHPHTQDRRQSPVLAKDRGLVALIRDAHPGYITWDEFEDNQYRLEACAQAYGCDRRKSPPGTGPALLQAWSFGYAGGG